MVVSPIDHNRPQSEMLGGKQSTVQLRPVQKGMGQVPDHLPVPPDSAFLEGVFSALSHCLVTLYNWITYFIQLPFQWLFGREEVREVADPIGNRPNKASDAALEENPEWKHAELLASMTEGDVEARIRILLEVADKAGNKDLKVKRAEAFAILRLFNEKEPDTFKAIITIYCAKTKQAVPEDVTELLAGEFKLETFYAAIVEYQLHNTLEEIREADPLDQYDVLFRTIPQGADRKLEPEKKEILTTVRILMKALSKGQQNVIGFHMAVIDRSERYQGALGFNAAYDQAFSMEEYLKGKKVHLGLIREALPQAYYGTIYATFDAKDTPIATKLDLLHRGVSRLEPELISGMLEAFKENNGEAHAILIHVLSGQEVTNKEAVLAAIEPTKQEIVRRGEEALQQAARATLLSNLREGSRPYQEQVALLKECYGRGEDREALKAFASVQAQREAFATHIVQVFDDEERAVLSALAKEVIPSHPDRAGLGSQLGMLWSSTTTAAWNQSVAFIPADSERTQRDKAAIEEYLKLEATYETLSREHVLIGLRPSPAKRLFF